MTARSVEKSYRLPSIRGAAAKISTSVSYHEVRFGDRRVRARRGVVGSAPPEPRARLVDLRKACFRCRGGRRRRCDARSFGSVTSFQTIRNSFWRTKVRRSLGERRAGSCANPSGARPRRARTGSANRASTPDTTARCPRDTSATTTRRSSRSRRDMIDGTATDRRRRRSSRSPRGCAAATDSGGCRCAQKPAVRDSLLVAAQ